MHSCPRLCNSCRWHCHTYTYKCCMQRFFATRRSMHVKHLRRERALICMLQQLLTHTHAYTCMCGCCCYFCMHRFVAAHKQIAAFWTLFVRFLLLYSVLLFRDRRIVAISKSIINSYYVYAMWHTGQALSRLNSYLRLCTCVCVCVCGEPPIYDSQFANFTAIFLLQLL